MSINLNLFGYTSNKFEEPKVGDNVTIHITLESTIAAVVFEISKDINTGRKIFYCNVLSRGLKTGQVLVINPDENSIKIYGPK